MKRHPALQTLSRDHQHALAVALALTRATAQSAPAAAREFLSFWHSEGGAHFRSEEEILLPAYAARADPRHPAVVQTLIDHIVIRRDAALVEGAPELATLQALGVQLSAHVRLEERELFPLVEETLPEDELRAVAARLEAAHPAE